VAAPSERRARRGKVQETERPEEAPKIIVISWKESLALGIDKKG